MPEGGVHAELSALVQALAGRLGTVPFAPHVTLLPGLSGPEAEVLDASRALSGELAPLDVQPAGVDGLDQHYRCLFFRVAGRPALREAHERSARRFGRVPDPRFDPHLSLVYGSLDKGVRAALTRELGSRTPAPFVARRLHVWRTEGVVGEWRELGAFDLGRAGPV
jgi:2'-5' RNA ligase